MNPEDIDLARLTEELKHALHHAEPVGYLRGKSLMRDVLVHEKGLSELEAEELIDTLELNGFLHFLGDPAERSVADAPWELQEPAGSVEDEPAETIQVMEISGEER